MWPRSSRFTSASTRPRVSHGGLGSRPAKNMLYSASSCLRSASRRVRSRSMVEGATTLPRDQEPDERQPQLARVRPRPIVDENLGGVGAADDLKEIAEP